MNNVSIYIHPTPSNNIEGIIINEIPKNVVNDLLKSSSSVYIEDLDDETISNVKDIITNNAIVWVPAITNESRDRIYKILHFVNDLADVKNITYTLKHYM